MTVGQPRIITPPCAVSSPMRAAGNPPIITVGEPMAITSGGPTQVKRSVTLAAGSPPMSTVGQPGGKIGPPTCGTGPVVIGHVCMSVMRAAGGISLDSIAIWMPTGAVPRQQPVCNRKRQRSVIPSCDRSTHVCMRPVALPAPAQPYNSRRRLLGRARSFQLPARSYIS